MTRNICLLVLLLIIAMPVKSTATLWNYSAHGSVLDSGGIEREISGSCVISDQLWLHTQPIGKQPVVDPVPASQYDYLIPEYSLKVGEFDFTGNGGFLYMEWFGSFMGDTMWFLENGTGAWNYWIGELFYFYQSDKTPYDISQYIQLSPIIQLTSLAYFSNDSIFNSHSPNLNLWLERKAPVPEPSIILLIGTGIIVYFTLIKRSML